MNNRILLPPTQDATIDAGLAGSVRNRRGSVFGPHGLEAHIGSSSSDDSYSDTSSSSSDISLDDTVESSTLFVPTEIQFNVEVLSIANQQNVGNNLNETVAIPLFTGGFTYHHQTLTWTVPGINHHGLLQDSGLGMGIQIEPDIHHMHHGLYDPDWVVAVGNINTVRCTKLTTGWCLGCGWKLVNPQRPNEPVRYCPSITPSSGQDNYRNYLHFSCSRSFLISYNRMRFAAAMCLYSPHRLRWAVSANMGHQGGKTKWMYAEVIDLFIGLKLSGQFHIMPKNWPLVQQYCLILRLTMKTTAQMKKKYQLMMEPAEDTNMPKYLRYFTSAFHAANVEHNPAFVPPVAAVVPPP